jgi:hypothetical protein
MNATMNELHAQQRLYELMAAAMQRGNALHARLARRLRHEAREAAQQRGHNLGRFSPLLPSTGRGGYSDAACTACGADVHIETAPAANSIDVAGEAVALGCSRV